MKRGLVCSLCALALALGSTAAQAVDKVNLSLNLRYDDPANPAEGGNWYLMAETTLSASNVGIVGISAYLNNILVSPTFNAVNSPNGLSFGNPTADGLAVSQYPSVVSSPTVLNANVATAGGTPFAGTFAGGINVVYGQDNTQALLGGVGASGGGLVATDPLRNALWNNSTLIASGRFAGTRPTVGTGTDSNVAASTAAGSVGIDADTFIVVRGDSVGTDGLLPGDLDRNGDVNINDFGGMSTNYGKPGVYGWDGGDFNNDGTVGINDFGALSASYNLAPILGAGPNPSASAAVAAVPEPGSVILLGIALLGLGRFVKRG